MDYNFVKDSPLLKQHVIYCARHDMLRNPHLWKTRAIISISDTCAEVNQMVEMLDEYDVNRHCTQFADDDSMSETIAKFMISFIDHHKDDNFVVHCFLGASRSAAVAKFIVDYLGLDDSDTANLKHYNKHVYNVLSSLTK